MAETRSKDPAAVALGRKGGQAIAKRGAEYFRELQAKRQRKAGGRPKGKALKPRKTPPDINELAFSIVRQLDTR